jgi:hypothetical protein
VSFPGFWMTLKRAEEKILKAKIWRMLKGVQSWTTVDYFWTTCIIFHKSTGLNINFGIYYKFFAPVLKWCSKCTFLKDFLLFKSSILGIEIWVFLTFWDTLEHLILAKFPLFF